MAPVVSDVVLEDAPSVLLPKFKFENGDEMPASFLEVNGFSIAAVSLLPNGAELLKLNAGLSTASLISASFFSVSFDSVFASF